MGPHRLKETEMTIRALGFGVIAAAAIAVWLLMAPPPIDSSARTIGLTTANYAAWVDQALSDGDLNEALAESAPQQQVVNGWDRSGPALDHRPRTGRPPGNDGGTHRPEQDSGQRDQHP
jgi:hypothetical protein